MFSALSAKLLAGGVNCHTIAEAIPEHTSHTPLPLVLFYTVSNGGQIAAKRRQIWYYDSQIRMILHGIKRGESSRSGHEILGLPDIVSRNPRCFGRCSSGSLFHVAAPECVCPPRPTGHDPLSMGSSV